jgi:proline iminopeptidase
VAAGIPALAGLLLAISMPRGPVTALQALTIMVLCRLAGVVAGLTLGSRWALLLAPDAYLWAMRI